MNGSLGLKVLNYITEHHGSSLVSICLNSDAKRASNYLAQVESLLDEKGSRPAIILWNKGASQIENCGINLEQPILGVSALFGHILPQEMIESFSGGILNLHPSFLPNGRGAAPIPWSIIERQPQGITLHIMNRQLDGGDIVFQKEIPTTIDMSAGDIYEIAMAELYSAFSRFFPLWFNGEHTMSPQRPTGISHHKLSEFKSIQIIKEDEVGNFGDFVRRLQATTLSDGRLPLFKDNAGKIWEVTFRISDPDKNKQ
jgi:methionyl-tRNA formyltransferase